MKILKKEDLVGLTERTKIEYVCECCGVEVETTFASYKNNSLLFCKSCKIKERVKGRDISLIVEKRIATCIERYGVANPQQVKEIRDKTKKTIDSKSVEEKLRIREDQKKTNIKRYGKEHYFETEEFKLKNKKTLIEKYGVDNFFKAEIFKERNLIKINNLIEKHKDLIDAKELEFLDYSKNSVLNLKFKCKKCGEEFDGRIYNRSIDSVYISHCPICDANSSYGEREIDKILTEMNIEFQREFRFKDCRNILPLPFDFYIEEVNTLIEFQGIQHYEFCKTFHKTIEDFYEQQKRDKIKSDYCTLNGIKLIIIPYWEDIGLVLDKNLMIV